LAPRASRRRSLLALLRLAAAPLLAGCYGAGARIQSALAPAGPQAARIGRLWWGMLAVTSAVFVAVMIALLVALVGARRRRAGREPPSTVPETRPAEAVERRLTRRVTIASAATVAILLAILVASTMTGRALASLASPDPLAVEVVGHQWWWEVHYKSPSPALEISTANEIHLPVGRPIALRTDSRDVIHSFWVPNLHGKRDLIPGRPSVFWLEADRPGVFRGQCAEFCGYQHAHMALLVIAEPPERFAAWAAAQRRPAAPPAGALAQRGQQVFAGLACPLCHAVQGTGAAGANGPDLTHLASRRTIAAGTLPNTPGALAGWIVDPQRAKPGTSMPPTRLGAADLQALLAYLGSLQ
jgi:cytochrome c oxidase subunit 2